MSDNGLVATVLLIGIVLVAVIVLIAIIVFPLQAATPPPVNSNNPNQPPIQYFSINAFEILAVLIVVAIVGVLALALYLKIRQA